MKYVEIGIDVGAKPEQVHSSAPATMKTSTSLPRILISSLEQPWPRPARMIWPWRLAAAVALSLRSYLSRSDAS